jgi:hypothetical protein
MKNFAKLLGIIAVVAVMGLLASCGEQGGTLVVKNGMTNLDVIVTVAGGVKVPDTITLEPGKTKKYTYDLDSDVTVETTGYAVTKIGFHKKVTVEKGETVTVTVKYVLD